MIFFLLYDLFNLFFLRLNITILCLHLYFLCELKYKRIGKTIQINVEVCSAIFGSGSGEQVKNGIA